jgi:hypothetical protein
VPGPASQQQHPATLLLAQEGQLVNKTKLLAAVEHREQRRREKHGEQLQEMPPAVGLLI